MATQSILFEKNTVSTIIRFKVSFPQYNSMIKDNTDSRAAFIYKRGPSMQLDTNPSWVCLIEERNIIAIGNRYQFRCCNRISIYCLKTFKPIKQIPCNFQPLKSLQYVPELRSLLAFGHQPSALLINVDNGFRKGWNKISDSEIYDIEFLFEENKVLAVGKFDGVKIWSLEDDEEENHVLQDEKLIGQAVVYLKGLKKVLILSQQRVAIASWPDMSKITFIQSEFGVNSLPIHALSYLQRFRSIVIYYLLDPQRHIWKIVDSEAGIDQAEHARKERFPFEFAGVYPAFLEPLEYFDEKHLIGLGRSGALGIARFPDGMVQTHLEDSCPLRLPVMWPSKNILCFVARSRGTDPLFSLQTRFFGKKMK